MPGMSRLTCHSLAGLRMASVHVVPGPISMSAAVLREQGEVAIEEIMLAPPARGEVLVRVAAAGVCHSDLHLIDGNLAGAPSPAVPGHEGAGVVESLGANVVGIDPGDHVSFCFVPACGECPMCLTGRSNLCEPGVAVSGAGTMRDGTTRLRDAVGDPLGQFLSVACFAEWAVVPAQGVVTIPARLPLWEAALVGCAVVTGVGAVRNAAQVAAGDSVCVVGCGGVGLQVIAAAQLAGADPIVAIDVAPEKLERAERQGATMVVNGCEERLVGTVKRATDGGVDHAFEVVGTPDTIQLAWRVTRTGGQTTVVGVVPAGVDVLLQGAGFLAEKSLRGSFYGSGNPAKEIGDLARLVADRRFDVAGTVSHRTGLDGLADALERLRQGEGARTLLILDDELAGVDSLDV